MSNLRLTPEQLRAKGLGHLLTPTDKDGKEIKGPKYGNEKQESDGLKFDSKKEERRYYKLKTMLKCGLITNLRHHVRFDVVPGVKFPSKKSKTAARYYEADFVYFDVKKGQEIVEDVKSSSTAKNPVYTLKKQLMMHLYNIEIQEV